MTRKFTFAIAFTAAATLGSFATADEPIRNGSPFRTAEYSQSDAAVVQVRDRGRSYRGGYYDGNRGYYGSRSYDNNYYSPYRYRSGYQSYPGYYYGSRNYGYNNYGRRGGVQVGPVRVWW